VSYTVVFAIELEDASLERSIAQLLQLHAGWLVHPQQSVIAQVRRRC
jgi:hypothetical protein